MSAASAGQHPVRVCQNAHSGADAEQPDRRPVDIGGALNPAVLHGLTFGFPEPAVRVACVRGDVRDHSVAYRYPRRAHVSGGVGCALSLPVPELLRVNTRIGLALTSIASGTFSLHQFFCIIPMDFARAAHLRRAGAWWVIWDVLSPLSRFALVVLMFLGGWTQFLSRLATSSTRSPDHRRGACAA